MCSMKEYSPVLAMYDVRGKQDFIFRTNKLKEIVGGSWIIRDVFKDYLYPIAKDVAAELSKDNSGEIMGIYNYHDSEEKSEEKYAFSEKNLETHLKTEGYIGELVYDGGGNFLLIFRNREIYREVTFRFTKTLKEYIGSLQVIGTCIDHVDFQNYKADRDELYRQHRITENTLPVASSDLVLPITQMNRSTLQPLLHCASYDACADYARRAYGNDVCQSVLETFKDQSSKSNDNKFTKEQFAKRLKFALEMKRIEENQAEYLSDLEKEFYRKNEKILDNLIEEKGKDSKLAVVYIDGNNMGAKVQELIGEDVSYKTAIPALRKFSEEIQKLYVEEGVEKAFARVDKGFRLVVSAGDEINFIVKAKDAFVCAKDYLEALKKHDDEKKDVASACAGIAVFHSHSPYADAYRIAEECCETGKKLMKQEGLPVASFIDFHICQGATGTSLEDIRKRENGEIISRPWMLWEMGTDSSQKSNITSYKDVERMMNYLRLLGRSNIKGLAEAAKESSVKLTLELRRIWGHKDEEFKEKQKTEKEWIDNSLPDETRRKLIYDIVIAYDLWFRDTPGVSDAAVDGQKGNTDGKDGGENE